MGDLRGIGKYARRLGPGLLLAGWIVLVGVPRLASGDEPGRFGRFFRFGGGPASAPAARSTAEGDLPSPTRVVDGPATVVPSGPQPRIRPQPRFSRAVTEADPVVTRISLARSDDGGQFGMFLQVYADGTVIDSEGVHRLGREGIKEVLSVLESSDIHRVRGHCGAPATDFVEHVQLIVYERSLGRLRASSFSFSGNPQGCDRSIMQLQVALERLQSKLGQSTPAATPAVSRPGPVIGLTPVPSEPSRAPGNPAEFDLGPVVSP